MSQKESHHPRYESSTSPRKMRLLLDYGKLIARNSSDHSITIEGTFIKGSQDSAIQLSLALHGPHSLTVMFSEQDNTPRNEDDVQAIEFDLDPQIIATQKTKIYERVRGDSTSAMEFWSIKKSQDVDFAGLNYHVDMDIVFGMIARALETFIKKSFSPQSAHQQSQTESDFILPPADRVTLQELALNNIGAKIQSDFIRSHQEVEVSPVENEEDELLASYTGIWQEIVVDRHLASVFISTRFALFRRLSDLLNLTTDQVSYLAQNSFELEQALAHSFSSDQRERLYELSHHVRTLLARTDKGYGDDHNFYEQLFVFSKDNAWQAAYQTEPETFDDDEKAVKQLLLLVYNSF